MKTRAKVFELTVLGPQDDFLLPHPMVPASCSCLHDQMLFRMVRRKISKEPIELFHIDILTKKEMPEKSSFSPCVLFHIFWD